MPLLIDELRKRWPNAKGGTLKRMVASGRVLVKGQPARKLKMELADGDDVTVLERAPESHKPAGPERSVKPHAPGKPDRVARGTSRTMREAPPDALVVVYEDEDVLVVHKPAGLLTSTTPREPRPTLLKQVRAYVKEAGQRASVGLIHRLDRDASGLLVFSKNDAVYESLKTQFFKHTVERVYLAVVHGTPDPPKGRIDNHLVELTDGKVVRTRVRGKGQHAVTDYALVKTRGRRSLVRVTLQTGRKHQIRAHLSQRGWPIVGDAVYGPNADGADPLHLCAVRLAFDHPRTGERKAFEVEAPFAQTN